MKSDGLLLGWQQSSRPRQRIGFGAEKPVRTGRRQPVYFNREGHLLTIAPTGAGKGVGCIIPALLTYPGPVFVIDPKGESFHVTARWRREIGQRVVHLDPFGVVNGDTDALKPLDILDLPGVQIEDEARALTELLTGGEISLRDPFWDHTSQAFISGLIAYLATSVPKEERRLSTLRAMFGDNDLTFTIAVLLDKRVVKNEDARQEFNIFLQHPERETRPSVQSSASQHLRLFGSPSVRRATDKSTFCLQDVIDGAPMTIYIIIPPTKLESHRSLLRLWLGTLLMVLTMRRTQPPMRTLLIVDEAAQLGTLSALKQTLTLYRGYGVQTWVFVQDASQLRSLYPDSWPAIVNNCSVVQLFGPRNQRMAREYASLIGGISARTIMNMGPEHQVLLANGLGPQLCTRPNYLTDSLFRGRYESNPMYGRPEREGPVR
jgi:type IV secretion system protein VirD4